MNPLFSAEFLKTKNTPILWAIWGVPLLILGNIGINFFLNAQAYLTTSPWNRLIGYTFSFTNLIYAILIAFVIHSYLGIEHQSNGWKMIKISPIAPWKILMVKYFICNSYILLLQLVTLALFLLIPFLLHWITPLKLDAYGFEQVIHLCVLQWSALCAIGALQFLLSLKFNHIMVSLSIALMATIVSFIAEGHEYATYVPYAHAFIFYKTILMKNEGALLVPIGVDVLVVLFSMCIIYYLGIRKKI